MAPLERQTLTIIGSISGVSPTANREREHERFAPIMLAEAVDEKTSGTMTAMNRSMSQVKPDMPLSKLVGGGPSVMALAMPPR